jgi:Uma2 family endonuclease
MNLTVDKPAVRSRKRWTVAEYYDAIDRGLFAKQRVYLYHGELIEMPVMGALHLRAIKVLNIWLVRTFDPEFSVGCQTPLELPDGTVPEPDGLVTTLEQDARQPCPNAAVLVVEISDSSLKLDHEMAFDYAAAGVPEYWIVNVRDQNIEVFRDPVPDPAAPPGFGYASRRIARPGETISPLAKPHLTVAVENLTSVS